MLATPALTPALAPTKGKRKRVERPAGTALDRRSWEYRLLTKTKAELAVVIGPTPSVLQAALAERAAWLTLHVAVMDSRFAMGRQMSDSDAREYASLTNLLVRTLGRLGKDKATLPAVPSLAEIVAAHEAEKAAAA